MSLAAGTLNRQVTLQRAVPAGDGQGGTTRTWTDVAATWAAISARGGKEFQTAKQTRATLTDEVRIRYRTGITADMRVVYGTRVLSIAQPPIDVDARHEQLLLLCEEIDGEAP